MFNAFSRSVMGASHEKKGIVCQDSSSHSVHDHYTVAVVADGHGSKKHFRSDVGSRCAVEATLETLDRFYADPVEFEENFPKHHKMVLENIEKQIISLWNVKVNQHFNENPVTAVEKKPFTPDEFAEIPVESYYGTTLIVGVICDGFSFGFQLGDGSLVAVLEDGTTYMPMDYNESNPANITSSMCNANAASMFAEFFLTDKKVIALFASTDGLYTSFGSDYDFLDYHTILTYQLMDVEKSEPAIVKNLIKRSHFGTEDDISLACSFDDDLLREKSGILKETIMENKKKAADRRERILNRK